MQNLLRHIKDIQQQAGLILAKDEITPEDMNFLHRYSEELKANINETVEDDMIRSLANEIPGQELLKAALNAKRTGFWDFDLPGLFNSGENATIEDLIHLISSKYAAIEMLLSNQINK